MMTVESIEAIEPLHVALLELGRHYSSGAITRARLFSRLRELTAADTATRRSRSRALPAVNPPVKFLSIEQITLPHQEQL